MTLAKLSAKPKKADGSFTAGNSHPRLRTKIFRSRQFGEEFCHEEGFRVALDDPHKAGTARCRGPSVPTSSDFDCAPVLELADRRDLHSRAASRHSGSDPRLGHQLLADRNR